MGTFLEGDVHPFMSVSVVLGVMTLLNRTSENAWNASSVVRWSRSRKMQAWLNIESSPLLRVSGYGVWLMNVDKETQPEPWHTSRVEDGLILHRKAYVGRDYLPVLKTPRATQSVSGKAQDKGKNVYGSR